MNLVTEDHISILKSAPGSGSVVVCVPRACVPCPFILKFVQVISLVSVYALECVVWKNNISHVKNCNKLIMRCCTLSVKSVFMYFLPFFSSVCRQSYLQTHLILVALEVWLNNQIPFSLNPNLVCQSQLSTVQGFVISLLLVTPSLFTLVELYALTICDKCKRR